MLKARHYEPTAFSVGDTVSFWRDATGWTGPAEVTKVTPNFVQVNHNERLKTSGFNRTRLLRRADEEDITSDLHTADITAGEEFLDSPGEISDSSSEPINDTIDPQRSAPLTPLSPSRSHRSDDTSDGDLHGDSAIASDEQLPSAVSDDAIEQRRDDQSINDLVPSAGPSLSNDDERGEPLLPPPRRSRHSIRPSELQELLKGAANNGADKLDERQGRQRRGAINNTSSSISTQSIQANADRTHNRRISFAPVPTTTIDGCAIDTRAAPPTVDNGHTSSVNLCGNSRLPSSSAHNLALDAQVVPPTIQGQQPPGVSLDQNSRLPSTTTPSTRGNSSATQSKRPATSNSSSDTHSGFRTKISSRLASLAQPKLRPILRSTTRNQRDHSRTTNNILPHSGNNLMSPAITPPSDNQHSPAPSPSLINDGIEERSSGHGHNVDSEGSESNDTHNANPY